MPCTPESVSPTRYLQDMATPSLNLVHDAFERERDRDARHFESIDAKAGVVLGFAGVIAALTAGNGTAGAAVVVVASVTAASLAVSAFWPRELPVLEPNALRRYLAAEESFTRLTLVATYLDQFRQSRDLLARKARMLRYSIVALAVDSGVEYR